MDNHKVNTSSRLAHLTIAEFTRHFNSAFPHYDHWSLHFLLCSEKHHMLTMLHTNRPPQDCLLTHSVKTQTPDINGNHYAHGCASQKTSQDSRTPSYLSIFFLNGYKQESLPPTDPPFKNEELSNTSDSWGGIFSCIVLKLSSQPKVEASHGVES